MEIFVVFILVGLAVFYLGFTFYRQFTGKAGCSSGCSCSSAVKDHCDSGHNTMQNLTLK